MKQKLIPAGQNPYRISANERAKLPAEFLRRNNLTPGESFVYLYLDGDLLVISPRPLDEHGKDV